LSSSTTIRKIASYDFSGLAPGGYSLFGFRAVALPSDLAIGTYHISVLVDDGEAVVESDESNNLLLGGTIVIQRPMMVDLAVRTGATGNRPRIAAGELNVPDLAQLQVDVAPGGKIWVTAFDITNTGLEASPATTAVLYVLPSATVTAGDVPVATYDVPAIGAGGHWRSQDRSVEMPLKLGPGIYYAFIVVDPENRVIEAIGGVESNNTTATTQIKVLDVISDVTPIWRVQARITTGTVWKAGTDDAVAVGLNPKNATWIDYPGNDFEAGSTALYDMVLENVATLSDISRIQFQKGGEDGWCVAGIELFINKSSDRVPSPIYTRSFSPCVWLDPPDSPREFTLSYAELRHNPAWTSFRSPDVDGPTTITLSNADLVSVVNASVGNQMVRRFGDQANWKSGTTIKRRSDNEVDVAFSFEVEIPGPNVVVDVALTLRAICVCGELKLTPQNVSSHLSASAYTEIVAPGAREIVSAVADPILTRSMTDGVSSVARTTDVALCPIIRVTPGGDFQFDFTTDPPNNRIDLKLQRDATSLLAHPGDTITIHDTVMNLSNKTSGPFVIVDYLWSGKPKIPLQTPEEMKSTASALSVTLGPSYVAACSSMEVAHTITVPITAVCRDFAPPMYPLTLLARRNRGDGTVYFLVSDLLLGLGSPLEDSDRSNNLVATPLKVSRPDVEVMGSAPQIAEYSSDGYIRIPSGLFGNRGLYETGPLRARFKLAFGPELGVFDYPALAPGQAQRWSGFTKAIPTPDPTIPNMVEVVVEEVDGRVECDTTNDTVSIPIGRR